MHSAPRNARLHLLCGDEARRRDPVSPAPAAAISASTAGRSGPSPKNIACSPAMPLHASSTAATPAGARFSGIMRAANTTSCSASTPPAAQRSPRTRPPAPSPLRAAPPRAGAPRAGARSRTLAGGSARSRLHAVADLAAGAPEVLAPVPAAPYLVPVDHEAEAAAGPRYGGSQQREVGERGGVRRRRSGARGGAGATARRARTPAAAECCRRPAVGVEPHPRPHGHHAGGPAELGGPPPVPLAQGQIGDLVPLADERSARLRYQRSAPPTVWGNRQS